MGAIRRYLLRLLNERMDWYARLSSMILSLLASSDSVKNLLQPSESESGPRPEVSFLLVMGRCVETQKTFIVGIPNANLPSSSQISPTSVIAQYYSSLLIHPSQVPQRTNNLSSHLRIPEPSIPQITQPTHSSLNSLQQLLRLPLHSFNLSFQLFLCRFKSRYDRAWCMVFLFTRKVRSGSE